MSVRPIFAALAGALALYWGATSCSSGVADAGATSVSSSASSGGDGGGATSSQSTAESTAATGGAGGERPCSSVSCDGIVFACGDCADNDDDGWIDAADPECLGACDDGESLYGASHHFSQGPCVRDCYFDADTNGGIVDDCYWSYACDEMSVPPKYDPTGEPSCDYDPGTSIPGTTAGCSELSLSQSEQCLDVCGPLVPNGCDCFGCCELPARSGNFVWLDSEDDTGAWSCDAESVGDPTRCRACTPLGSCFNACDDCELCVGSTSLPDGCREQACPEGSAACGVPGQESCDADAYCVTGCCQPALD